MRKKSPVQIREFRSSDLQAVKKLINDTIDVCYPSSYCEEAIRFFKQYHDQDHILKGATEGYMIVLEQRGKIVATGTITDDHIMRVFVSPEYQKNGFGKIIMRDLEQKAVSQGLGIVTLDASLPSKAFYDSIGYIVLEETFLEVENGIMLNYYKMEKELLG